jgi:hypothetical protein
LQNKLRFHLGELTPNDLQSTIVDFLQQEVPSLAIVTQEYVDHAACVVTELFEVKAELEALRHTAAKSHHPPNSLLCTLAILARSDSTDLQILEAWNAIQPDLGRLLDDDEGAFATLLSGMSTADQEDWDSLGVDTLFAMQRDFSCLDLCSTACRVLFGMAADAAGIEGVKIQK